MTFTDQVAIVTGGASGIGLAISRQLQADGAFVAIFDYAESLAEPLKKEFNGRMSFHCIDVTDETAVREAVDALVAQHGRVDILVNSAGITGKTNLKSHEVSAADFQRVMQLNLMGSFYTSKAVLPHMLARGYGRILHIASIAGKDGNAGMLAYSTSKAAVIGMTKVQGKDYAETGITINALAPAVIRTPMVEALPETQVKYMTDRIPMKRCGSLAEVAAMGCFIVSPATSFTTGFTFDLTGGRAVY